MALVKPHQALDAYISDVRLPKLLRQTVWRIGVSRSRVSIVSVPNSPTSPAPSSSLAMQNKTSRKSASQVSTATAGTSRVSVSQYRGVTTAEKWRGTNVWVPKPGRLRPATGQRPGWVLGARGCRLLPQWGSGVFTPGKFLRTQMLNPVFW